MKRTLIPLLLFAGLAMAAARPQEADTNETFETEISRRAKDAAAELRQERGNELRTERFTYSGILIQALKADNVLQLINPFYESDSLSPEDNLIRDPISNRPKGLKLFVLEF